MVNDDDFILGSKKHAEMFFRDKYPKDQTTPQLFTADRFSKSINLLYYPTVDFCDDEGCPHHGIDHICINVHVQPALTHVMHDIYEKEDELFRSFVSDALASLNIPKEFLKKD